MAVDFTPDNPELDYQKYEKEFNLRPGMLYALVQAESAGNPKAVSPVGAVGVGQFMPQMVKKYKVNLNDPNDQLRGSAEYMRDLLKQYDGNERAALAHYNGGAANAEYQITGIEPTRDKVSPKNKAINQNYVRGIMTASKGKIDFEADEEETPEYTPADVPEPGPISTPTPPIAGQPGGWKSAAIGVQEGLTAGLGKYANAGMAYLADRIPGVGSGKDVTWNEALGATRDVQSAASKQHTAAYYGGAIGGGAGLAYLTGGASLGRLAGTGAAIGAISGATANPFTTAGELAKDTAIGGTIGGALGAVGGIIPKIQGSIAKKIVTNESSKIASLAQSSADDAIQAFKTAYPQHADKTVPQIVKLAKVVQTIPPGGIPAKVLSGMTKADKDLFMANVKAARAGVPNPTSQAVLDAQRALTTAKSNLTKLNGKSPEVIKKQAQTLLKTQNAENMIEAAPAVGRVIKAGAIGGGAGSLVGHPIQGAIGFAGNELRQLDTILPIGKAAWGAVKSAPMLVPNVGKVGAAAIPTVVPPVVDNRTRLQKLADAERERMGQ